jgi:hypothetical protein
LFFEKKVDSFSDLMKEVDLLDLDSGIRMSGDYGGKKRQFVFVTRSPHDTYTLMVYSKTGKSRPLPGRRLLVKEFNSKKALADFLKNTLSKPIEAFVY